MITYADDLLKELQHTPFHGTAKISVNGFIIDSVKIASSGEVIIYSKELEERFKKVE